MHISNHQNIKRLITLYTTTCIYWGYFRFLNWWINFNVKCCCFSFSKRQQKFRSLELEQIWNKLCFHRPKLKQDIKFEKRKLCIALTLRIGNHFPMPYNFLSLVFFCSSILFFAFVIYIYVCGKITEKLIDIGISNSQVLCLNSNLFQIETFELCLERKFVGLLF